MFAVVFGHFLHLILGMFVMFFIWRCLHLHLHSKMFRLKMFVFAFHSVFSLCISVHSILYMLTAV